MDDVVVDAGAGAEVDAVGADGVLGLLDVLLHDPEIDGGGGGDLDPLRADFAGDEGVVVVRLRDDLGGQEGLGAQIDVVGRDAHGGLGGGDEGTGGREEGRTQQESLGRIHGGGAYGARAKWAILNY